MILTIINAIMLIIMVITVVVIYTMINAFGELIVRFVEKQEEHFKKQKHLVEKSNEMTLNLSKIQQSVSSIKNVSRRFESAISKLEKK